MSSDSRTSETSRPEPTHLSPTPEFQAHLDAYKERKEARKAGPGEELGESGMRSSRSPEPPSQQSAEVPQDGPRSNSETPIDARTAALQEESSTTGGVPDGGGSQRDRPGTNSPSPASDGGTGTGDPPQVRTDSPDESERRSGQDRRVDASAALPPDGDRRVGTDRRDGGDPSNPPAGRPPSGRSPEAPDNLTARSSDPTHLTPTPDTQAQLDAFSERKRAREAEPEGQDRGSPPESDTRSSRSPDPPHQHADSRTMPDQTHPETGTHRDPAAVRDDHLQAITGASESGQGRAGTDSPESTNPDSTTRVDPSEQQKRAPGQDVAGQAPLIEDRLPDRDEAGSTGNRRDDPGPRTGADEQSPGKGTWERSREVAHKALFTGAAVFASVGFGAGDAKTDTRATQNSDSPAHLVSSLADPAMKVVNEVAEAKSARRRDEDEAEHVAELNRPAKSGEEERPQ